MRSVNQTEKTEPVPRQLTVLQITTVMQVYVLSLKQWAIAARLSMNVEGLRFATSMKQLTRCWVLVLPISASLMETHLKLFILLWVPVRRRLIKGIAVVDEEAALLCEGGFADEYTGICGEGPNSLNMGETCSTNSDCGSSDSNYEVSCKCGWNSQGTKHCDALKGDTPYKEARQAFKEYYDASTTCHLAARWESCDVAQKYHNWYASAYCRKCKELRAQYYVELLHTDQLSCMA